MRVWDLDTQHCCQTVVGQRGEVWTLDVDPSETRLATGSADGELRLYRIVAEGEGAEEGSGAAAAEQGAEGDAAARRRGETLLPLGSVRRQAPERAALVRFSCAGGGSKGAAAAAEGGGGSAAGALLTCQSAGKVRPPQGCSILGRGRPWAWALRCCACTPSSKDAETTARMLGAAAGWRQARAAWPQAAEAHI